MMKMNQTLALGLASVAFLAAVGAAHAQSGASPAAAAAATSTTTVKKGVTLGAGKINLTLTVEPSLSKDSVFKPFSIAPDLSYGVTSKLTLAIVHSGAATTGFRGAAGNGICLSGTDGGCPKVYRNVGFEGLYSLVEGPVAAAANVGVHLSPLTDPTTVKIKIGAKARAASGIWSVAFNPSVFIAANERDAKNKDGAYLPIALAVKPMSALTTGIGTGVKLPDLGNVGDTYQIPMGVFAQGQLGKQLSIGASFVFGNVVGGPKTKDGLDGRFLQAWASYTL